MTRLKTVGEETGGRDGKGDVGKKGERGDVEVNEERGDSGKSEKQKGRKLGRTGRNQGSQEEALLQVSLKYIFEDRMKDRMKEKNYGNVR